MFKQMKYIAREIRYWVEDLVADQNPDHHHKARMVVATVMVAAVLLPWMPVGSEGHMNGPKLLSHIVTGLGETLQWLEANPIGAILFIITPPVVMVSAFSTFWKTRKAENTMAANLATALLPLATMKWGTMPMMDGIPADIGGLTLPAIGLTIIVLANVMLAIHGLTPPGKAATGRPPGY